MILEAVYATSIRGAIVRLLAFIAVMALFRALGVVVQEEMWSVRWFAQVFLIGLATDGILERIALEQHKNTRPT